MPKTEYEKGYEDGFTDGFSFCQKIYSSVIDIICKALQKKEKKERQIISEQPKRRSKRGGFRDIPIDGSLQVGDIVYTKANAVLDIGMVKSVNPLEVYSRCTRYDYGYPSFYGAPEICRWYNSGVNAGERFLTMPARTMSAGRLGFHICDADFAGGFGCRHFFCGRHLSKRKKYFKSVTFY